MNCRKCGDSRPQFFVNDLCEKCQAKRAKFRDDFWKSFAEGFQEADEEIRYANPHIYGAPSTKWADTEAGQFHSQFFSHYRIWHELYTYVPFEQPAPRKPPWPKPDISVVAEKGRVDFKVLDQVTEGWVMVPLEALEAKLGRKIDRPAQTSRLYRDEILECAQRLLILLVYGCPPRITKVTYAPI